MTTITYTFYAKTRYNEDKQMWFPVVLEYRNGLFASRQEYDYPCQEQELALMVAMNLRDEQKAMVKKSTTRILDEMRKWKGNPMNDVKKHLYKIMEEAENGYNQYVLIRELCAIVIKLDERLQALEQKEQRNVTDFMSGFRKGLADEQP